MDIKSFIKPNYKITKKINRFNYLNFETLICHKCHRQDKDANKSGKQSYSVRKEDSISFPFKDTLQVTKRKMSKE